jgi:hypothetical protein
MKLKRRKQQVIVGLQKLKRGLVMVKSNGTLGIKFLSFFFLSCKVNNFSGNTLHRTRIRDLSSSSKEVTKQNEDGDVKRLTAEIIKVIY